MRSTDFAAFARVGATRTRPVLSDDDLGNDVHLWFGADGSWTDVQFEYEFMHVRRTDARAHEPGGFRVSDVVFDERFTSSREDRVVTIEADDARDAVRRVLCADETHRWHHTRGHRIDVPDFLLDDVEPITTVSLAVLKLISASRGAR